MGWHDRMNRAIEYIESNLANKIDMEKAAQFAYQSAVGFQRTFSIVTDMSVSEYVRRRRLSLAAFELQNSDVRIIDIALKYDYDSPDAFTRAFKEIYGLPPSVARDGFTELKLFPRISFYMSIKGDVAMEPYAENSGMQITNMYYARMPAFRLIGKRYTSADLDAEMMLGDRFNEWFQNDWFNLLFSLGGLPGHEHTALCAYENKGTMAWWIGVFAPDNTPAPEGFTFVDFPAGIAGMCWMRGYKHTGEIYSNVSFDKCKKKLLDAGNTFRTDFNGEICQWSFQRYDNTRFFVPDSDGKVIMDYGVYLVETEEIEQAILAREKAELFSAPETSVKPVTEPLSTVKSPDIRIEGVAPYHVDAQSNLLFCALTTVLLKLDNINESTPYFCQKQNGVCNNCGDCGDKPNIHKHHLSLYHFLVTVSGVGFMIADRNENENYDLKTIPGIMPPLLEDRLDFAMKARGIAYTCPQKSSGEKRIFEQIKESIKMDRPVLMKLGYGPDWCVITGYNEETGAVYGLDASRHYKDGKGIVAGNNLSYMDDGLFALTDWFKYMKKVVIPVSKIEKLGFNELIKRMIGQIEAPDNGVKSVIPRMIQSITPENARGIADFLNITQGYMMEARWHAGECFTSTLLCEAKDQKERDILRECAGHCFEIHDLCWKIRGQLGIGPHTDFGLPNLISQMMLEKTRQEILKDLFGLIWENEQAVLRLFGTLALQEPNQL